MTSASFLQTASMLSVALALLYAYFPLVSRMAMMTIHHSSLCAAFLSRDLS